MIIHGCVETQQCLISGVFGCLRCFDPQIKADVAFSGRKGKKTVKKKKKKKRVQKARVKMCTVKEKK